MQRLNAKHVPFITSPHTFTQYVTVLPLGGKYQSTSSYLDFPCWDSSMLYLTKCSHVAKRVIKSIKALTSPNPIFHFVHIHKCLIELELNTENLEKSTLYIPFCIYKASMIRSQENEKKDRTVQKALIIPFAFSIATVMLKSSTWIMD